MSKPKDAITHYFSLNATQTRQFEKARAEANWGQGDKARSKSAFAREIILDAIKAIKSESTFAEAHKVNQYVAVPKFAVSEPEINQALKNVEAKIVEPKSASEFLARHKIQDCYTVNGKPIRAIVATNSAGDQLTFPNAKIAAKALGLAASSISAVLLGKRPSSKGFKFQYEASK